MTTSKSETRNEYVTRDSVLRLLSNDEVSNVASAEADTRLADGEEYLDLERLEHGVLVSPGVDTPMGSVLPKKAVSNSTWGKILVLLSTPGPKPQHRQ